MKPISEVQLKIIKPKDGLVAFASLVLDQKLYLSSIGVFSKLEGGYRITYPTKKVGESDLHIFHPITKELGQEIEKAIIRKVTEVFEAKNILEL